jgi:hypothetical protein
MDQDPTLRSRSQVDAGSSRSNQEMQDLMRALESMGYAGSEGDQKTQGEGDQKTQGEGDQGTQADEDQ